MNEIETLFDSLVANKNYKGLYEAIIKQSLRVKQSEELIEFLDKIYLSKLEASLPEEELVQCDDAMSRAVVHAMPDWHPFFKGKN